jgi:hypothetical protein
VDISGNGVTNFLPNFSDSLSRKKRKGNLIKIGGTFIEKIHNIYNSGHHGFGEPP